MDNIKVTFNNETHEYKKGIHLYEVSKDCLSVPNIVAAEINNEIYSLDKVLNSDSEVTFINYNNIIGNKII